MIRKMAPQDAGAIEAILAVSPGAALWPARELLLLAQAGARIWVAEEEGEIVGFLAARSAADELEILNLAVGPEWRCRGIGCGLMAAALTDASRTGASRVFLEVRESNLPARSFYAGLGFAENGRRRAYYRHPAEDALVLTRPVHGFPL
jgi:[ribosomal protein S18]-alanine N-acetyltransferase